MRVIFLQNTIFQGRRYRAGDPTDVPKEVAKKLSEALLAYAEDSAVEEELVTEETVDKTVTEPKKTPAKQVTRKAAQK